MVNDSTPVVGEATRLRHDDPDYIDAFMFLVEEAELLDDNDLGGWLSLISPEISYRMPVQVSRATGSPRPDPSGGYLLQEDYGSLGLRVKRLLGSDTVWAENPPSRTRRFVSNARVRRSDDGRLQVRSYQLLMRNRGDSKSFDIVSSERADVLERDADGRLKLRSREITIDQARLGVRSLPVPL